MKKYIKLILVLPFSFFLLHTAKAQVPQSIPYQAVARDSSGTILAGKNISLRISIHDSTATGTVVYKETHTAVTNTLGLFTVNIGKGTPVIGIFASVNWGVNGKYMQVELDANGGSNFVNMGTQQLNSVAYALYSGKTDAVPSGTSNGNTLRWNGTAWITDSTLTNKVSNVGIGTSSPASSALLDVSSTTKGFMMPRMTTAQRNAIVSPSVGLQIFNTDNQCVEIFDGTNWILTCGLKQTTYAEVQGSNQWTKKADFIDGRLWPVAFAINNKGYVGTGLAASYKNDFWEYDPSIDAWAQKANVGGGARAEAVGFSVNGKGYIATGFDGTNKKNDVWEYDPTLNSWTQKNNFSGTARSDAASFVIGSKAYIGTGEDVTGARSDFWEYDPLTDSWTAKANVSITNGERKYAAGFAVGQKGYIIAGMTLAGTLPVNFGEYDPATNTWTQKINTSFNGRRWPVAFTIEGKAYAGLGYSTTGIKKDFYEFNPANGTWFSKADFVTTNYGMAAFSIGNRAYITGGGSPDFYTYTQTASTPVYAPSFVTDSSCISDASWTRYGDIVYNNNLGNIGIGTKSPASKLEVVGTGTFTTVNATNSNITTLTSKIGIFDSLISTKGALYLNQMNASQGGFGSDKLNSYVCYISNTGQPSSQPRNGISIYAEPGNAGSPSCHIGFFRTDGFQIGSISQANMSSTSVSYNTTSDERLKRSFSESSYGLNALLKIHCKNYLFKDSKEQQNGFIAQQLYQHYPFAVKVGGADPKTDPWMVDYGKLTPLIVKAVQELNAKLEQENAELKSEIQRIKAHIGMDEKAEK